MTKSITNISPQGDLDLPLIGRIVAAGETVEVPEEIADILEPQAGTWLVVDSTNPTIADLKEIAQYRGVNVKGLRTKAELHAALSEASAPLPYPPALLRDEWNQAANEPAVEVEQPTAPAAPVTDEDAPSVTDSTPPAPADGDDDTTKEA